MKFGYQFDSPAYEPRTLEAKSIIAAVEQLQDKVPVKEFQRAGHPDANFHVELWEDKGVERKDMSFEDLKEVYKLYPASSGCLVSSELCEKLWSELHAPGMTQTLPGRWPTLATSWHGFGKGSVVNILEDWLGAHHSRGIDYLRHGDLGDRIGERRLAEIGRALLENADLLTEHQSLTMSRLCNMAGITHKEAICANLIRSDDSYFTVCRYDEPMGRAEEGEWYSTVEEAISCVQENMACTDLSLFLNNEKGAFPIGDVVDGQWQSPIIVSKPHLTEAQDAIAAVQAASLREKYAPYYDRLYYVVCSGQTPPPTNFPDELKLEAREQGIYDLDTALDTFSLFEHPQGKTLYACYGREVAGQCNLTHVPLVHLSPDQELHFYNAFTIDSQAVIMAPIVKACLSKLFPDNEMQSGKWGVKLIHPGATYGDRNNLTNASGKALVEFYDCSQDPDKFPGGQFVARYYADTLLGRDGWGDCRNGLSLCADIRAWTVKGEEMRPIRTWLLAKEAQQQAQRKPSLTDRLHNAGARQRDAAADHNNSFNKDKEVPHERS